MTKTNVTLNRAAVKYRKTELMLRLAWYLCQPLFRFSPHTLFVWRSWLLRCFGAKIGKNVHIYRTVKIEFPWTLIIGDFAAIGDHARVYNLGPLEIGKNATVSQFAHLCGGTHAFQSAGMELIKSEIRIGDDAWVCADAFVGPGVVVGEGAVVGARAVVTKEVEPWTIVAGNPAKLIRKRTLK